MTISETRNIQRRAQTRMTVARTIMAAGVTAAALAYGAKSGKFTVKEDAGELAKTVLPYLEKAGNFVNKHATNLKQKLMSSETLQKVDAKLKNCNVKDKARNVILKGIEIGKAIGTSITEAFKNITTK